MHKNSHKTLKPTDDLQCCICQQVFSDSDLLEEHLGTHANDTLLVCAICNYTFVNLENLTEHMIISHRMPEAHKSKHCNVHFDNAEALGIHESQCTDTKNTCPLKIVKIVRMSKTSIVNPFVILE